MKTLAGEEVNLAEKYKGKVVLVVNVASKCGLTPQYTELQKLHEKYHDKGLAVVGFPCNQFGKQEPGSSKEIATFCTENYGVTFDMFEKIEVNGDEACELYKQLTATEAKPVGAGKISWNFEKFLVGRDGKVVARFSPRTTPDDKTLLGAVEKELNKEVAK
ncbi:MAG: glutathione peroxidase [Pirellulaceae bacterium]